MDAIDESAGIRPALGLSIRTTLALMRADIRTVGDLLDTEIGTLAALRGFGPVGAGKVARGLDIDTETFKKTVRNAAASYSVKVRGMLPNRHPNRSETRSKSNFEFGKWCLEQMKKPQPVQDEEHDRSLDELMNRMVAVNDELARLQLLGYDIRIATWFWPNGQPKVAIHSWTKPPNPT